MKFLRAVLPNVTIALNIAILIVIYLDMRNPMMGFLMGAPFLTLIGLCAASSIATAVVLYADWRSGRIRNPRKKSGQETQKISE